MRFKPLFLLVAFFISQSVSGQLSKRHYFPPMPAASFNNINSAVPSTPYLYLSTPETDPVNVTVHTIAGGSTDYSVSNGNPITIAFNSNGYLSPFFIEANEQTTAQFGIPLTDKGVWLEAEKEIYANLRVNSLNNAQAEMLTSKGSTGIGTTFYTGHLNNTYDYGDRVNFVSLMSLSNNNQVTISGLNPLTNLINLGSGNTAHTVTLQMHETLVFAATPYNSQNPNIDGAAFIGKLLSSSEDIVVNVGSTNGNMGDVGNGRDYGFDQIVPVEMIGDEYLLVQGNGTYAHERPIFIATEPSTNLYFNDNPTPVTLLNPGNYYISDFVNDSANYFDENGILSLRSSKPVYVYQPVMADPGCCTQGMYFVPPLNCAAPNYIDEVSDISRIGTKNFTGSVNLISRKEATVDLHNDNSIMTFDQFGSTGQIPANVNLAGPFFGTPDGGSDYMVWKISGLTGSVKAFSDYDLYTGVFGYSSVAGWGGFYSGFGQVPEITATMEPINCIPSILSASIGFAYYQWFKDGEVIPGATQVDYEASESGTYYVLAGLINCPPVISPDINLSDPEFLNGGDDISACPGSSIQLQASSDEDATTYSWSTSGDGYFDDEQILGPTYFPGEEDNSSGSVLLTVSGNNNGCLDEETVLVSLEDVMAPDALCQSIVVALDFYGMASIVAQDIDAGSSDNCLLESIWANPEDCIFNCDDVGDNLVELVVSDFGGNQSVCLAVVSVVDLLPSVAICKDLVLELDDFGFAQVTAEDIDYGSFDNCAIYSITIDEGQTTFDCDDLGMNFVDLDITDSSFNLTSCESEIEVVDFISPEAYCIDLTIYLDENGEAAIEPEMIDDNSIDNCTIDSLSFDGFDGQFNCVDTGVQFVGLVVTDQSGNIGFCISNVEIIDTIVPMLEIPNGSEISSNYFINEIEPLLLNDSCFVLDDYFGAAIYEDNCTVTLDQACSFVIDECGQGFLTRYWVAESNNGEIFTIDSQLISIYHLSDWEVVFPLDFEYDCQSSEPIEWGFPVIETSGYELIDISFIDVVGNSSADACYSITREWTLINWCTYPDEAAITYNQTVHVIDDQAPDVYVEGQILELADDACTIDVELPIAIIDDCSDSLEIIISHEIPQTGAGPGLYTVNYSVSDPCGNNTIIDIEISIVDLHAPVLEINESLDLNINSSGLLTVFASDFDLNSYDNCTSIFFSFSEDPSDSIRIYDCDMLGTYNHEIWAWDNSGNQAVDEAVLNVLDDIDFCPDFYRIEGLVYTEFNDPIQSVEVQINYDPYLYITDNDGYFIFNVLEEQDYTITPFLDSDILNGVTVYDLVLITQHILGMNTLDSPYQLIAADANNNQLISTMDILAIRKVILQMEDTFPNNTSWRFVDADFVFPDPLSPWVFPESIDYLNLEFNQIYTDFIGVKIGDVNGSAQANGY